MRSLCRCVFVGIIAMALWGCASAPPPKPTVFHQQLINNNARDVARLANEFLPLTATCDARTNIVILQGPQDTVRSAAQIFSQLDTGPSWEIASSPNIMFAVRLKNVHAEDIAAHLTALAKTTTFYSGPIPFAAASYEPTNVVWIDAPEFAEPQIRQIINEFERSPDARPRLPEGP